MTVHFFFWEFLFIYIYLYYYLRGFLCLDFFFFFGFKNAHTLLCLSRNKTKGQFGKNTTLTPTKTLPKK